MTVADDLRAARALIDTPEKYLGVGPGNACWRVSGTVSARYKRMAEAFGATDRRDVEAWALWHSTMPNADDAFKKSMALFDRAITTEESRNAE